MMRLPGVVLVLVAGLVGGVTTVARADSGAPRLTLTGPARAPLTSRATLSASLGDDSGALAGRTVTVQRESGAAWHDVARATTAADGTATYTVRITAPTTSFRAVFGGDATTAAAASDPLVVTGFKRSTRIGLSSDRWSFVDETAHSLRVRWVADDGTSVPGTARILRRVGHGSWQLNRTLRIGADGTTRFTVRPREDTHWRAVGDAGAWWLGATSASHFLDNLPPGTAVAYPRAAPAPQVLPVQPHAQGDGPNAVVGRLSSAVWGSMTGRSWHRGCPIGRDRLRIVRVNYWDFAGYRRRGEVVLRASVAGRAAAALAAMYRQRLPIRAMYRVDRFGYSARTHGGDDYAAMQHDDTSGFNCRWVDGRPGVMSPHAYGTAIDINTFENPYHSAKGIVPDAWWAHHSAPRIAWRSASDPVVRIWRAHGFHWTYGNQDPQHLDGRAVARRRLDAGFVAD